MTQEKLEYCLVRSGEREAHVVSYLNFFEAGHLGAVNTVGLSLVEKKYEAEFKARFPKVSLSAGLSYRKEYLIRDAFSRVLSKVFQVPEQDIEALCMLMKDDKQFYLSWADANLSSTQHFIHRFFIQHASDALKNDFDVVMLAVQKYSQNIAFISENLRADARVQAAYQDRKLQEDRHQHERRRARGKRVFAGSSAMLGFDEGSGLKPSHCTPNLSQPEGAAAEAIHIPGILKNTHAACLLLRLLGDMPDHKRNRLPPELRSDVLSVLEPPGPPPAFLGL